MTDPTDPPSTKIKIMVVQTIYRPEPPRYQIQIESNQEIGNFNVTVVLNNDSTLTNTHTSLSIEADTTKLLQHSFSSGGLPASFPMTMTFTSEEVDAFALSSSPVDGPIFTDDGNGVFSASNVEKTTAS